MGLGPTRERLVDPMNESSEYVSPFVNQDKYPRPVLKPLNELPAQPGDRTVILTTQDNQAFQRFDDRWNGQSSGYYGYNWPEVMHYHGEDFIVLWQPELGCHVNSLVSAIEAVPGALTVQSASTETGWGVPTEATICLAGQNHAVQAVVDAFREVARRDFQRLLPSLPPEPRIPPGQRP